jgi:hypothetical protein
LVGEEVANLQQELLAAKEKLTAIPEVKASAAGSPEEEVGRGLDLLDNIRRIARDPNARLQVLPLLQRLGMKLGMRFTDVQKKVRRVRRLAGGMISFGDEPFPCRRTNGGPCRPHDPMDPQMKGVGSSGLGPATSSEAPGIRENNSNGELSPLGGVVLKRALRRVPNQAL